MRTSQLVVAQMARLLQEVRRGKNVGLIKLRQQVGNQYEANRLVGLGEPDDVSGCA